MIDGRFDQHLLELFAASQGELDHLDQRFPWLTVVFALGAAVIPAIWYLAGG